MTGAVLAAACVVVVLGCVLQGAVGFGSGLIAVPLLVLLDSRLVPGPLIAAGVALSALVLWRDREGLVAAGIGWTLCGRVPGSAVGAAALGVLPAHNVNVMLGLLVLVAVVMSLSGLHPPMNRRSLVTAGLLSGFMNTTSSIGGPPLALIYQRLPGRTLRAVLAMNFVAGGLLSLAMLCAAGRFGAPDVWISAVLILGAVLGFALSRTAARYLDTGRTRAAVLAVSAASSAALLLRELL